MASSAKSKKTKIAPGGDNSVGVLFLAFGHFSYYVQAYAAAWSIKYHNNDVKIALACDNIAELTKRLTPARLNVFDSIEQINVSDYSSFAEIKLNLDRITPFDNTLYLDVDVFCVKDISGMFDYFPSKYAVHVNTGWMLWATREAVDEHFDTFGKLIPSVNSSVQWIPKGSEVIFNKARKLIKKPLPLEKLKAKWGGGQPDELYLNVALSSVDHSEYELTPPPVLFATRPSILPHKIHEDYYFLSYFGPRGHTPQSYVQFIDNRIARLHIERGEKMPYRIQDLLKFKHANKR